MSSVYTIKKAKFGHFTSVFCRRRQKCRLPSECRGPIQSNYIWPITLTTYAINKIDQSDLKAKAGNWRHAWGNAIVFFFFYFKLFENEGIFSIAHASSDFQLSVGSNSNLLLVSETSAIFSANNSKPETNRDCLRARIFARLTLVVRVCYD